LANATAKIKWIKILLEELKIELDDIVVAFHFKRERDTKISFLRTIFYPSHI
jgi:hypothetical protein